jgi:hypothetical protein
MAPIHHIHVISSESLSLMSSVPFFTSYFNDPWTLPSLTMSYEVNSHIGMEMTLSAKEIVYQYVLDAMVDPDPFSLNKEKEDPILEPIWVV